MASRGLGAAVWIGRLRLFRQLCDAHVVLDGQQAISACGEGDPAVLHEEGWEIEERGQEAVDDVSKDDSVRHSGRLASRLV